MSELSEFIESNDYFVAVTWYAADKMSHSWVENNLRWVDSSCFGKIDFFLEELFDFAGDVLVLFLFDASAGA